MLEPDPMFRCEDCGEELWGPAESRGVCIQCQNARDAESDGMNPPDGEYWDEPDVG